MLMSKEERGARVTTCGRKEADPASVFWMRHGDGLRAQAHTLCKQEEVMFHGGVKKRR